MSTLEQDIAGIGFPVEVDGESVFVTIPASAAFDFAEAIFGAIRNSLELDRELDAERDAHVAISKARGH